ncbi:MAG TPA: hypothetical protein VKH46_05370 [Thermoanaerobaculia bacterium]|jgi:hypothetical protein|nr:hypothetical protein [Thermoanaerobaculia bacterium]
MPHRRLFQAVSGWSRNDHAGAKINGDVKGFVPSDRIVRYLQELQRRRWNPEHSLKTRSAH